MEHNLIALKERLQQCNRYCDLLLETENMLGISRENNEILHDILLRKVDKSLTNSEKYGGGLGTDIKKKLSNIKQDTENERKYVMLNLKEILQKLEQLNVKIQGIGKLRADNIEKGQENRRLRNRVVTLEEQLKMMQEALAKASVKKKVKVFEEPDEAYILEEEDPVKSKGTKGSSVLGSVVHGTNVAISGAQSLLGSHPSQRSNVAPSDKS